MWLITTFGFFSIVEKPGDRAVGMLTVRARVRSDLEDLKAGYLPTLGGIEESSSTDYRYRARAPKADVGAGLAKAALAVDYSNFKNAVAQRQGHAREKLYHGVWDVLYKLQKPPPLPASSAAARRSAPFVNAYGGVLIDDEGRVLLREPRNHFDGYVWTFPKGKADGPHDRGETCALREVKEETGYDARVIEKLPGAYRGGTSVTQFFLMRPNGEPTGFDAETSDLAWVTFGEARRRIDLTTNLTGRRRDQAILADALGAAEALGLVRAGD